MRVRYFLLGKDSARENGKLVLGEEFENEDKALVHSLVEGVPFLGWRPGWPRRRRKATSW